MGVVLPPMHILWPIANTESSVVCAPYTQNGYQWLDKEGSISQELLGVSQWSRYHKVGHDLYNKNSQLKHFWPEFAFYLFGQLSQ